MALNHVQNAAFSLIQSDAKFLYSLIYIQQHAKNIRSNYIMMCQPYIGIFANGAEQWCRKAGMEGPAFTPREKTYYEKLRQGHKLLEKSYTNYNKTLMEYFELSNQHFYSKRSAIEKIVGYKNVGVDLYGKEYCGNTILCAMHTPPFQLWIIQQLGRSSEN